MKKCTLKNILCLFLVGILTIITILFSVVPIKTFAAKPGVADTSGNASDYSFDTFASTAAAALSDAIADEKDSANTVDKAFGSVKAPAAGGLLAYTNKNNSLFRFGLFMTMLTAGSNTMEYKTLSGGGSDLIDKVGGHTNNSIFTDYVATGAVFADMGIDTEGKYIISVNDSATSAVRAWCYVDVDKAEIVVK